MTRILVPVDGSKHALRGVRKLIGIAQWWLERPEIVPLYVHLPVPRIGGMASLIGAPALRRYYKEEGEAALASAVKALERAGYTVHPAIMVGPVAETIVAYAKRHKCDLICLGTRGMTAAANLVMGSVAAKVLHLAGVPVIIVR